MQFMRWNVWKTR